MLKDKVIIVAGGNGLLGKEMIYDITKKGGIAICADISLKTDLSLNKLNFDVTSVESIVNAYQLVNSYHGKIDGLVNNAYPRTKDWGNKFEDIKLNLGRKTLICK